MKTKKLLAILLVIVMATMLCVSAFADGAVATDGKVYITKTLNIAAGLTAPEEFTFEFTPVTVDDVKSNGTNMPAISSVSTSGIKDQKVTDGNIIKNVEVNLASVTWPHAGEFVYTVTEKNNETEGMTYSDKSYTMTVRVKNGENGPEVDKVTVTVTDGDKIDPTKPTDDDPDDEDDGKNNDGFNFDNTYVKVADNTPTDEPDDPATPETEDKASYVLTKTVAGQYGDKTKQFKFSISVDTSATNVASPAITYQKVSGTTKTTVDPANFSLADGEKLIIEGAPVGTKITVTENLANDDAAAKKYTAAVTATADGQDVAVAATGEGANAVVENALIGEGVNNAAYENTSKDETITPTGILMNNLPYIILLVVVFGGLTGYIVSKRRREQE